MRRRLIQSSWAPRLAGAMLVAALLLLLQGLIGAGLVNRFLVPLPSSVLASFPMLVTHEGLPQRFAATFAETFAAASLATLVGMVVGWALYRWRIARRAYLSWVVGIAAAPLILVYPLFLVLFGRSMATIVAMSFVSALTPIVLKTYEGLAATRPVLLDVGRSFSLSPLRQFWMIHLPAAIPTIFNGVRLGLIYALLSVVAVEYLIDFGGLGQLVADLADRYEMPAMYAAILFVAMVSACFFFVLERLEEWLRPA
jgi:ABC-type nitrate/sulfonate/bicarbonate transport system permease component